MESHTPKLPKFFLTKVWGYDPTTWPVLGFGTIGGVNKLGREYNSGDWIVLAGTQSEPTQEEDRGRLLGMVQVTNMVIDVLPILISLGTTVGAETYKEDGSFKWPKGFPYLKALSFIDKPLLKQTILDRSGQYDRAEAAYAIELSEEHARIIWQLPNVETAFPMSPLLETKLRLNSLITNSGPVPAIGSRSSEYADGENLVYVFRISNTNFYKVGRTNSIERRLAEFNKSPHAIWAKRPLEIVNSHPFQSAECAHKVEQMLHQRLNEYAVTFECYEIPRESIAITALGSVVFEYSEMAQE